MHSQRNQTPRSDVSSSQSSNSCSSGLGSCFLHSVSLHQHKLSHPHSHRHVEQKLLELLNMRGRHRHKWDFLRHVLAEKVVYDDNAFRVWYAPDANGCGLLYSTKQAQVSRFTGLQQLQQLPGAGEQAGYMASIKCTAVCFRPVAQSAHAQCYSCDSSTYHLVLLLLVLFILHMLRSRTWRSLLVLLVVWPGLMEQE